MLGTFNVGNYESVREQQTKRNRDLGGKIGRQEWEKIRFMYLEKQFNRLCSVSVKQHLGILSVKLKRGNLSHLNGTATDSSRPGKRPKQGETAVFE